MRFLVALAFTLSPAAGFAQEAAPSMGGMGGSPLASMLPMVLIFVVFYFLLIRPQQKKFKEHTLMLNALKRGDSVVTSGGILGKITEPDKDGITTVEIAPGVTVRVTKQSISALVDANAKPMPMTAPKKKGDDVVKNDNVVLKDNIANDN